MDFGFFGPVGESFFMVAFALGLTVALFQLPQLIREFFAGRRKQEFECSCCGNCCRFKKIDVSASDRKRLEDAGHNNFLDTSGKFMKIVNGRCFFLRDDKCTAHEHRPDVCRKFPFYRLYGLWMGQRVFFCPAMDRLFEKK